VAKYDSMRKLERNRLLVDYRRRHPEVSLSRIGDEFDGITKQRVSELLKIEAKKKAAETAAA